MFNSIKTATLALLAAVSPVQAAETSKDCHSKQAVLADLNTLYETTQAAHYNLFFNTPKSDYDAHFERLSAQIDACMSTSDVQVLLQKFMSFGRIAHARIDLPTDDYIAYRDNGGALFPASLKSDGRNLWVSRNLSLNTDIQSGDRIVSINGVATETLLHTFRSLVSADTDRMFGGLLESYFNLLMWLEYGPVASFELVLQRADDTFNATVAGSAAETLEQRSEQAAPALQLGWERVANVRDHGIGYLRPGPFFNAEDPENALWDTHQFIAFIDAAFAQFKSAQVRALLIDLRDNPGGDNSFSDPMVAWFADRPFRFAATFRVKVSEAFKASNEARLATSQAHQDDPNNTSAQFHAAYQDKKPGEFFDHQLPLNTPRSDRLTAPVFLLINRHSYSNTVTVAAMAQDYGFATVLGEETTDLATTHGAMEQFTLPNTGIQVGFPKARIVRPSGDTEARGVVPDHAIATPLFEDTSDPVLRQALGYIEGRLDCAAQPHSAP